MERLSLKFLSLLFVILIFLPQLLYAHRVNIYAYESNGTVYCESYFADGSRCKNCSVEVFDKDTGKNLLEGRTDENGKFSFKAPAVTSLKLVLKAGAGHQSVYYLSLGEQLPADKLKNPDTAHTYRIKSSASEQQKCPTSEELEAIVNRAIEAKLQPVTNQITMLRESADKVKVSQIIGGIGYIFGIIGFIMYFKSRKNQANKR